MKKLTLINPDDIIGRKFRVPSIYGLGSGDGFEFAGLHLLEGWKKAIPELKQTNRDLLNKMLNGYCEQNKLPPGKIFFDEKTGILNEVCINTSPVSRVSLADELLRNEYGVYKAENVNNLRVAIILQRLLVVGLFPMWEKLGFQNYVSYMFGEPGSYHSTNLKIPDEFWEQKEPLTDEYFQKDFGLRASNIAGRFGLTLEGIQFDNRGILRSYDVSGNACSYYLDPSGHDPIYHGHNVDTAEQVATLHGIGATFLNWLWKRKSGGYYRLVDY